MLTAEQLQCIIGRDDKEQPQDRKELYLPLEEKVFFQSIDFGVKWDDDIMKMCQEFQKWKGTAA